VPLPLVSLLAVVVALLAVRATNRDRRDYRRFKKLKSTRKRQRAMARWLRESFFLLGGLAAAVLLATYRFVPLVSKDALAWSPLAWLSAHLDGDVGAGVAVGAGIVLIAGLVLPVILFRRELEEIPTVGDVGAMLPRTRGELIYGAGLAINAGLVEELLFRLGMPALLFGITRNGLLAFGLAALLFGLLHLYQGVWGVLGATLLGIVFTLVYLLTGSILVVIVVHALVDLRSLVLIPVMVKGVHRITGPAAADRAPDRSA
jgi:membrane protease YdiL (CAAX protease family)